jgi:hypothetical protein
MTVNSSFLSQYPSPEELKKRMQNFQFSGFRDANSHIHTPYSFSAFSDVDSIFSMAKAENISVLGINDFYVTDGYEAFYEGCVKSGIFPLFNIEFIGLMKEEQKNGIRINDPNNPGRIYFCGKGLDFPFHLNTYNKTILDRVKEETQNQLRLMVSKLNGLIRAVNPELGLDFDEIKKNYAHELVRERHIAKAFRVLSSDSFISSEDQLKFIESVYGGKKSKAGLTDTSILENEIRSNLLKAGGAAFVEEDESSFLEINNIRNIITDAGGIPCYPVLLDDPSGKCTEYEADAEKLYTALSAMGIGCIELIPGRNDLSVLEKFVEFFDSKGFIITFGTEHNAPGMIPLAVSARGYVPLSTKLKQTGWRGVCVIAAHQYLRAQNGEGYIDKNGKPAIGKKADFEKVGQMVIEYYISNFKNETRNF